MPPGPFNKRPANQGFIPLAQHLPGHVMMQQFNVPNPALQHETPPPAVQYDDGSPAAPSIWSDPGAIIRRLYTKPDIDRPIFRIPTGEREPESDPPQTPVWINSNKPPFVNPPVWSVPVSNAFTGCVPTYMVATSLGLVAGGCMQIPHDKCLVVRSISYEALNAALFDTFQFQVLVNGSPIITIEDMYVQNTPNPAQRYGLAGHFKPMPVKFIADHDSFVCVTGTLLGPITIAGPPAPGVYPGLPYTSGNCQMKLILNGWLAPIRDIVDGGPRPTDLGDMDFQALDSDQGQGGFT